MVAGLVLLSVSILALSAPAQSARRDADAFTPAKTFAVDDDGRALPGNCDATDAAFIRIQAAVDAATAGSTIRVCPGTYNEQVVVRTADLTIFGAGMRQTTIRPSTVSSNTTELDTVFDAAAIVVADSVTGVTLRGLTIDGSAAALPAECPPYFGVFYRNASGTVDSVRVTGILACLSLGIFVQSSGDGVGRSNVAIRGSTIDNYGAGGITCNEVGTSCLIKRNTITGRGEVPASPIGIQIGFGAAASVTENRVQGNMCSLAFCGPDPLTQSQAPGILAYQAARGSFISENQIVNNDAGIYLTESDGCCITTRNWLTANRYLGIGVQDGNNTTSKNEISGGDYGIVALAFSRDTMATSRNDDIRRPSVAPARAFSCCGYTAEVLLR